MGFAHPEPVTYDDEFELLLSSSKFFKFILVGFVPQFLQTSEIFTFFYKRKVEKSKGGNQKNFLSFLKASIIKKQGLSKTIVCFFMKGLVLSQKFQLRPDRDI